MSMEALAPHPAFLIDDKWNLTPANGVLARFLLIQHRKSFELKVDELRAAFDKGLRNADDALSLHHDLMDADQTLHAIQCAFDLKKWSGYGLDKRSTISDWHACMSREFGQLVDDYMNFIRLYDGHLPSSVKKWHEAISTPGVPPKLQQKYAFIANQYEADTEKGSNALIQRSRIDPDLIACDYRVRENHLLKGQADFTVEHQAESQAYFRKILGSAGRKTALLSEVRDFESSRYSTIHFTLDDVLSVLRSAFGQCHPECLREFNDVLANRRLRLLPDSCSPDLCLDTPFGSHVQLYFDGSLASTVRLAHELGHAVHQYLHRHSDAACLPLTEVDSETWALDFETVYLDRLGIEHPEVLCALNAFKQSQRIEMNHRHRMLHGFEQALHKQDTKSVTDVNALWLNMNRLFYGESIEFDDGFEHAWMDVHHLFTAPFYLMVYGIAKDRADTDRPTLSINQQYPTKEKTT